MSIWLAPMMGYTNAWFRAMIQAIHSDVSVMTEMVTLYTLKHVKSPRSVWKHPLEKNTALQVACGSLGILADVFDLLSHIDFDHINLNAGCPSAQVGKGVMGASMLYYPELTCDILQGLMKTGKHISLKTRLGIDNKGDVFWDDWFAKVSSSGVKQIFLHAREAILGLNTVQNRSIPPLRYDRAESIMLKNFDKDWVLNGGLKDIESVLKYKEVFSGVMIGRASYNDPGLFWSLAKIDGCADFSFIKRWLSCVEDYELTSEMIVCLLVLTKGLRNAKAIRDSIVSSKGQKYKTGFLSDMLEFSWC